MIYTIIGICIFTKMNDSSDVYLSLNGTIIPNHGFVVINNIGSNGTTGMPLICNTNRPPNGNGGDWISPTNVTVGYLNGPSNINVPGFERDRDPMVVRLWRNPDTTNPLEGIYHCSVNDISQMLQRVYVGLYNDGGGKILIYSSTSISYYSFHFFRKHKDFW